MIALNGENRDKNERTSARICVTPLIFCLLCNFTPVYIFDGIWYNTCKEGGIV